MADLHHRDCHLCEACCSLVIETEGPRVVKIQGDKAAPFSQGHFCIKANALKDLHEDPDRLRRPMRRKGDKWTEIGWDEALDEVAKRFHDIQKRHGNDALSLYLGNPTVHNYGAVLFGLGLRKSLKTRQCFSATSVDQLPKMFASYLMYGHQLRMSVPDIDRCDYLIILGANPVASGGSIMTAPGIGRRLKALQKRGGQVVVVDPRRTETALLADAHHYIQPGTDAYLLAGILHCIFKENWIRLGHLADHIEGLEALEGLFETYSPEAVADITGIGAQTIQALARGMVENEKAIIYGRLGTCVQAYGGLNAWMLELINLLTGNLDQPGGMMFPKPAFDLVSLLNRMGEKGSFDRYRSRVRNLPEFGGEFPAATMADEMTHGGPGQIRGLLTFAGNPVLSTPNGKALDKALSNLDFMVSIDLYLNETTRHADIILPPVSPLERSHMDLIFMGLAVRNYVKYSPPLFEPPADSMEDWQILNAIETRLNKRRGGMGGWMARMKGPLLNQMGPEGMVSAGFTYFQRENQRLNRPKITLNTLKAAPHGIDLGPLMPQFPGGIEWPNKRIQLAPQALLDDVERLKDGLQRRKMPSNGRTLSLIGRRHIRDNNTWLHNSRRLQLGKNRCTLYMHPDDAKQRGLSDGQRVEIRSAVGAIEVPLAIHQNIMPGVVSLPHGYGHTKKGTRLSVAQDNPGASMNDLTDALDLDPLTGTATLNGIWVEVTASLATA